MRLILGEFEPIMNGENLWKEVFIGSNVGGIIEETLILLLWMNEEMLRTKEAQEVLKNVWK